MTETLAITVTLVRQIKVTSLDAPEAASPGSAADHDPMDYVSYIFQSHTHGPHFNEAPMLEGTVRTKC